MFDDGERKVNKITSRGQNVDRINIVLAFNVCRSSERKEQFQVSVVFARNASRGFSLNRRMKHETTQRIVADVNACEMYAKSTAISVAQFFVSKLPTRLSWVTST